MHNSLAIYDIGLGGISLIEPIRKLLPELSITYVSDLEYFIYDSTTGFSDIQERTKNVTATLFDLKCNLVLLAAHTLTLTSLPELQQRWLPTEYPSAGKNVIGIFLSINQDLLSKYWHLRDEVGVLLASHSAIRSGYYQQEALKLGFNNLVCIPSDKLTTAIEFGDETAVDLALREVLRPFSTLLDKVRYVLPASTHFHFIHDKIAAMFSPQTFVLNSTEGVAQRLVSYINKHPEYKVGSGEINFYTTGNSQDSHDKIKKFYGEDKVVTTLAIS